MWTILMGALTGYLAGQIIRGEGYGALGNIILGIFGGIVGGLIFWVIGLGPTGLIGEIISGTAGALILIYFFRNSRIGSQSD